jgi:hypothetical protein
MAIYNTAILATNTTLATGSGDRAITSLIVCNTTAGALTCTLYAVANGNSAGTGTMIVNAVSVPAGDTFNFDTEKLVLTTGDTVVAVGSSTGLTATVSILSV